MSWIQTFTGKQFYPLEPREEDVDILDVAHALSLLCRFNGHARCFYSVADHSVRVSRIVAPEHALWGLLHDAGEAYLGDTPRPVKGCLPVLVEQEDRLLEVLMKVLGLPWPMPAAVREADDTLLATEARDLMKPPPSPWGLDATPLAETVVPLSPEAAERAFLERYEELGGPERQEAAHARRA